MNGRSGAAVEHARVHEQRAVTLQSGIFCCMHVPWLPTGPAPETPILRLKFSWSRAGVEPLLGGPTPAVQTNQIQDPTTAEKSWEIIISPTVGLLEIPLFSSPSSHHHQSPLSRQRSRLTTTAYRIIYYFRNYRRVKMPSAIAEL